MTPHEIAHLSVREAQRNAAALSTLVVERIALSLVAQWLYEQDDSIDPAKALTTFNEAMRVVKSHFI